MKLTKARLKAKSWGKKRRRRLAAEGHVWETSSRSSVNGKRFLCDRDRQSQSFATKPSSLHRPVHTPPFSTVRGPYLKGEMNFEPGGFVGALCVARGGRGDGRECEPGDKHQAAMYHVDLGVDARARREYLPRLARAGLDGRYAVDGSVKCAQVGVTDGGLRQGRLRLQQPCWQRLGASHAISTHPKAATDLHGPCTAGDGVPGELARAKGGQKVEGCAA